jgi:hypothetical protein
MQFMIFRKADRDSEAGVLPGAELLQAMREYNRQLADAGIMRGGEILQPSATGVRLRLAPGGTTVVDGPFTETKELIAGFSVIDAASKQEAIEWLSRWPCHEGAGTVELELRESGCAGGCAEVGVGAAAAADAPGKRFVVLLRSSADLENEVPVAREKLDALDANNAAEAKAGVLLSADGLRSSARGARVTIAGGKVSVVDGPFTEIKEMIAGYWMIRAPSLRDAIEWAKRNPYPTGPQVEVEIRQVCEMDEVGAGFTPELREAEQRMRAGQLEAGMRAQLAAASGARR